MSRPLTMSFRPDALDLCLDGRKTQTRRVWQESWFRRIAYGTGYKLYSVGHDLHAKILAVESIGRVLWAVGDLIGLKRKRTGRVEARVLCTGLRVEHVQDITEEDAIMEGIERVKVGTAWGHWYTGDGGITTHATARAAYEAVWRRLYPRGPQSWEANPLVVVISFEVPK